MAKIKILHVIRPAAGGMKNHLLDLVKYTDKDKYQVEVAVPYGSTMAEDLKNLGIKTIFIPLKGSLNPFSDVQTIMILVRYLMKNKVDIIHTHSSKAALVGRIAGIIVNTPIILFTAHNSIFYENWPQWKKSIMAGIEKFLAKFTDKIITVSNALKKEIMEQETIPEDKIVTIYNGVDVNTKENYVNLLKIKRKLKVPHLGQVVGVIARLAPQKGVGYFLKAASLLKEHQANFLIIGDGPLREELEAETVALGLKNRVFFAGFCKDAAQMMPVIDVFVLPSVTEGLPLTILEALAVGRPTIATKVGGIPEVIINQKTGILVEPKDPEALALAIADLLTNREKAFDLGKNGKSLVVDNFSIDHMIKRTMELYNQLLEQKRNLPEKEIEKAKKIEIENAFKRKRRE